MQTVKEILVDLIGEWNPITTEGAHFQGIDFEWIAAALIVGVVLVGLFGIVRAVMRR